MTSMFIKVWIRNDETGLLDDEFKDGDVDEVRDVTWIYGLQETKSWLILKIDNVPNAAKILPGAGPHYANSPLAATEYGNPPSANDPPPIRYKRKHRVNWRAKFSEAEIAIIEDGNAQLPDGQTSSGGTVVNGIVQNLFVFQDLLRK